ncbi:MAG: hypothetical protein M3Y53_05330 [Thermoproteota archaeon]|nr:hypothetical protein [Thermoproteota archaeon]
MTYNQNKIDGLRTWSEFEKEMNFYIPVGVILIELEDCSDYASGIAGGGLPHDEIDFVTTRSRKRGLHFCALAMTEHGLIFLRVNSKQ